MNKIKTENNFSSIKRSRIFLPILLGLGIVVVFIYRDFKTIDFSVIHLNIWTFVFIFLSFVMIFFRDFGYVVRIRYLSDKQLSWKQSLRVIMLWEFASAVTPSAVGGTSVATLFLWKEGINLGKSTSIVLVTSFLDELYFSIMLPLVFILFSKSQLFNTSIGESALYDSLFYFAIIGYFFKLAWMLIMAYSLFVNPRFFASILRKVFSLRILKKWKYKVDKLSVNFIRANKELKTKSSSFWLKSFLATFVSWTSRYWVLNFLLYAMIFSVYNISYSIPIYEHLLIFAKQLIMWIMMLVMPTPGGSGFVETVFNTYMSEFVPIPGFTIIIALLWRIVTYYPYLIIGAFIAPKWIENFNKNE